jgi:hypothetical protein
MIRKRKTINFSVLLIGRATISAAFGYASKVIGSGNNEEENDK